MPDEAMTTCELTVDAMRILLVYTHPDPELTRALAREGHDVLTVADTGRPAKFLGVFKPTVLLVVARQAAEQCRGLRRQAPDVPILAIVPGREVDQRVAALEAGADDALATPFHRDELIARIRAATRHRMRTSVSAPIAETPRVGGAA